jgi:short-subunit dehydrogenase
MPRQANYAMDDGVALVTGAAGGIGSALSERLVRQGSHVTLVDADGEGLDELAERLRVRRPDRRITTVTIDLTSPGAPQAVVDAAMDAHGRITLVVNNAGAALAGRFEQVSMEDADWLLGVNLRSVIAVTSAALPHLRRDAHITNVSSLFGIIAPVGNAIYSASKFGVRGFSMALRSELRPREISVTVVHPGGIRTGIARRARRGATVSQQEWDAGQQAFERFLVMDPVDAARKITAATIRRRARVLVGSDAIAGDLLARIAPAGHAPIFEFIARKRAGL